VHDSYEREVRDLPWRKYQTTVIIELYRVRCPECGVKVEEMPQLPSKAPFSKDFEDAVGWACESASVRQVARQFGMAASTVRAIDLRYLQRWSATRRKARLEQMGVDEIYFGKQMKFITVVSNLETGEPLWFGQDRKQETLDEFFRTQLREWQRKGIEAACVDMWRPYTNSIARWAPNCCTAAWMVRYGIAQPEQTVHILQGVEVKRPSHIFVRASKDGDTVKNVRVGGHAVPIMQGTYSL
jgi:transposase